MTQKLGQDSVPSTLIYIFIFLFKLLEGHWHYDHRKNLDWLGQFLGKNILTYLCYSSYKLVKRNLCISHASMKNVKMKLAFFKLSLHIEELQNFLGVYCKPM